MKRAILVSLISIFVLGCKGYKGASKSRSPEELKIAAMATELSNQVDQVNQNPPAPLASEMNSLAEAADRFDNASQRFGSNSIEARDAFDKLRYHASQLNPLITKDAYPDLFDRWQKLRTETIKKIAVQLGYRPEE